MSVVQRHRDQLLIFLALLIAGCGGVDYRRDGRSSEPPSSGDLRLADARTLPDGPGPGPDLKKPIDKEDLSKSDQFLPVKADVKPEKVDAKPVKGDGTPVQDHAVSWEDQPGSG